MMKNKIMRIFSLLSTVIYSLYAFIRYIAYSICTLYRFRPRFIQTIQKNKTKTKKIPKVDKSITKPSLEYEYKIESQPEVQESPWLKAGQVAELYIYPLMYGKGLLIQECNFTFKGEIAQHKEGIDLQVSMFAVYHSTEKCIITYENYPALLQVELIVVDKKRVKFTAVSMPDLFLDIYKVTKNNKVVECHIDNYIKVNYIDCGPAVARWISKCLTGEYMGLRLGSRTDNQEHAVANTIPGKRSVCSFLTTYYLMSLQTIQTLAAPLNKSQLTNFRSNIFVYLNKPFVEDNWEWVKIGDVIMIAKISHRSFRKKHQSVSDEITAESIEMSHSILCKLRRSGRIKIGDDVYVLMKQQNIEEL